MGVSFHRGCPLGVLSLILLLLSACNGPGEDATFEPLGPELAARSTGCDFGRMSQDARSYLPGSGSGSPSAEVQSLINEMGDACADDDPQAYTVAWFQMARVLADVLAAGTGGAVADGVSFLHQSLRVTRPNSTEIIFDPCDGLEDCSPWDGYPDSFPNFAAVLGAEHGAWAVVPDTVNSVCSDFTQSCEIWAGGPDTWGVEPATTWEDALWGHTSLLFGYPLDDGHTDEEEFGVTIPAYQWLLIPYPDEFGPGPDGETDGELLVSLCSNGPATVGQLMMQKGSTILTESTLSSWCNLTTQMSARGSLLERLAAFLSPAASPLYAVVAFGPGGGGLASSFTDFYGVDIPTSAIIAIPSQPADGKVGQSIKDVNGNPFRVLAYTSSEQSPIERAAIHVEVVGNSGLVAAGDSVTAATLECAGFECDGVTLGDQFGDDAGTLFLPLEFTKTGQYSLCFTAELEPLQFNGPVCTEKLNIRP